MENFGLSGKTKFLLLLINKRPLVPILTFKKLKEYKYRIENLRKSHSTMKKEIKKLTDDNQGLEFDKNDLERALNEACRSNARDLVGFVVASLRKVGLCLVAQTPHARAFHIRKYTMP